MQNWRYTSGRRIGAFTMLSVSPRSILLLERDATQQLPLLGRNIFSTKLILDPKNYFLQNGMIPKDDIKNTVHDFEAQLTDAGGIDLQILGYRKQRAYRLLTEPGPCLFKTRLVTPGELNTNCQCSRVWKYYQGSADWPPTGISTIMKSRRIFYWPQ